MPGEVMEGDVAGHNYPSRDLVIGGVATKGLDIVEDGFAQYDCWAHCHLLLQSPTR